MNLTTERNFDEQIPRLCLPFTNIEEIFLNILSFQKHRAVDEEAVVFV